MKKSRFILYYFLTAVIFLAITSCEDYLDQYPVSSLAEEEIFESIDGVERTLNGLYSRLGNGTYNHREMNCVGGLKADNLDIAQVNAGRLNQHQLNAEGEDFGIWSQVYDNINRVNTILANIDDFEDVDQDKLNNLKAQALAMRGYMYFDLLKIYARPPMHQEPLVKGEPLGVIIKTEPFEGLDESAFEERATIDEGYEQVQKDLTDAVDLFDGSNEDYPYRFTQTTAEALLARLHLYLGNWGDAIDYAEDVMDYNHVYLVDQSDADPTTDAAEDHPEIYIDNPGQESIFEIGYTSDDRPDRNTSVAGMATWVQEGYGDVILRMDLRNLLEEYREKGDVRPIFVEDTVKGGQDVAYQMKYYHWQGIRFWDNIKMIRSAEMWLIAAEAYAEMDDVPTGVDYLEELRAHRMDQEHVEVNPANKDELIDMILRERRVEFFNEMSHRWFDLRRRGRDIPKGIPDVDSGDPLDFENYKVVDKIPEQEISSNDNCVQNPGY